MIITAPRLNVFAVLSLIRTVSSITCFSSPGQYQAYVNNCWVTMSCNGTVCADVPGAEKYAKDISLGCCCDSCSYCKCGLTVNGVTETGAVNVVGCNYCNCNDVHPVPCPETASPTSQCKK